MNLKKIRNLIKIERFFCAIIALAVIIFPLQIFAIGQTTDPIVIKNAVRGNEYQKTMTVINTEKKESRISFAAEGDIGEWAEFYSLDDYKTPLEYVDLKQGEAYILNVVFTVPQDTPNGKYKGFISALLKPDSSELQEGSGASVSQKIDREVSIEVGGKEVVSFDVSVIPKTYDLQKNETLSIRLIYDNQGNVSITPQAQIRITPLSGQVNTGDKSTQAVYNTIYPYPENQPAVKAGAIYEISPIEIPTGNFAKGKYVVDLGFMENGKLITEKKFVFSSDVFKPITTNIGAGITSSLLGAIGFSDNISANGIVSLIAIAAVLAIAYLFLHKRLIPKKADHEKK